MATFKGKGAKTARNLIVTIVQDQCYPKPGESLTTKSGKPMKRRYFIDAQLDMTATRVSSMQAGKNSGEKNDTRIVNSKGKVIGDSNPHIVNDLKTRKDPGHEGEYVTEHTTGYGVPQIKDMMKAAGPDHTLRVGNKIYLGIKANVGSQPDKFNSNFIVPSGKGKNGYQILPSDNKHFNAKTIERQEELIKIAQETRLAARKEYKAAHPEENKSKTKTAQAAPTAQAQTAAQAQAPTAVSDDEISFGTNETTATTATNAKSTASQSLSEPQTLDISDDDIPF